jgi:hypothetical protein
MFEKRLLLARGGVTAETEIPLAFDVLDHEGREVAQLHLDGNGITWRVLLKGDLRSGEARFNSSDEALASLERSPARI